MAEPKNDGSMSFEHLPGAKPFVIGWLLSLFAMESLGSVILSSVTNTGFDFRSFYTAGYLIRTNRYELYNLAQQRSWQHLLTSSRNFLPFYHPSYETILLAPLSLLHYRPAYFVFIACNFLFLLASFLVARNIFSRRTAGEIPAHQIMFLSSFPY